MFYKLSVKCLWIIFFLNKCKVRKWPVPSLRTWHLSTSWSRGWKPPQPNTRPAPSEAGLGHGYQHSHGDAVHHVYIRTDTWNRKDTIMVSRHHSLLSLCFIDISFSKVLVWEMPWYFVLFKFTVTVPVNASDKCFNFFQPQFFNQHSYSNMFMHEPKQMFVPQVHGTCNLLITYMT